MPYSPYKMGAAIKGHKQEDSMFAPFDCRCGIFVKEDFIMQIAQLAYSTLGGGVYTPLFSQFD